MVYVRQKGRLSKGNQAKQGPGIHGATLAEIYMYIRKPLWETTVWSIMYMILHIRKIINKELSSG